MKLRIKSVDMNGYWGREFHPALSDVGLEVYAVKLDTRYVPESASSEPVVDDRGTVWLDAIPSLKNGNAEGLLEIVWTVVTEDNRVLQLMDFEVEPLIEREYGKTTSR